MDHFPIKINKNIFIEKLSLLPISNVGEDVEKREPLYTVGGNVNWGSLCGKWYGGFSKKQKNRTTI